MANMEPEVMRISSPQPTGDRLPRAAVLSLPTHRRAAQLRRIGAGRRGREAGEPSRRGRAWINGREVGGADARFAHLVSSYD